MNSQPVYLSNFAAERAAATDHNYEAIEMTYPGGLTQAEYDALEAPAFTDDENNELDSLSACSTNTFTDGFNPYELQCSSAGRAFNNNFDD